MFNLAVGSTDEGGRPVAQVGVTKHDGPCPLLSGASTCTGALDAWHEARTIGGVGKEVLPTASCIAVGKFSLSGRDDFKSSVRSLGAGYMLALIESCGVQVQSLGSV